jgi:hypothetical protein
MTFANISKIIIRKVSQTLRAEHWVCVQNLVVFRHQSHLPYFSFGLTPCVLCWSNNRHKQTIWQGDNQPCSIIHICVCVCVCDCVFVHVSLSLWLQLAQESVDETFWSSPEHVWIWMESGDVLRIQFSDGLTLLFRSHMMVEYTVIQWAHRADRM